MSVDMRISEMDWSQLRRHFATSFRGHMSPETGALAVLGECKTSVKHELIVSRLLLPEPGDLKVASSGEVVFASSYVRRAHLEMRRNGLAGIAAFHTHPLADTRVNFSSYDDDQEPILVKNLMELEPRTQLISVVAGKRSQCGRMYDSSGKARPLRELIIVGDRLTVLGLNGLPPASPPMPSAVFDRGQALTGSGALHRLSHVIAVVVGGSGTGSLFCELLARAGCKHIIVIDHDVVKDINLNRILHATADDAKFGTSKVEVIRRAIEAMGLGCRVEAIQGSILDRDILRRVLDAGIVLGCIDRDLPRQLLSEVTFRYLLPYIDVGSEIGGDEDGIVSVDSRVSYVAPGRPCLMCSGVVTPRRLRFESYSASEREREIALGYSDDLLITQPAVMDLNMRAASNGMLLLRHLLQPFLADPYPIKLCENAVTYTSRPVTSTTKANLTCPTCRANRRFGYGDVGPALGFDAETARRILGRSAFVPIFPVEDSRIIERGLRGHHFFRRIADGFSETVGRLLRNL